MAENSAIDWLRRGTVNGGTWNPWFGCSHATYIGPDGREHAHPGCHGPCYAEAMMDHRYHKCVWGSAGTRVMTAPGNWSKPRLWNAKAQAAGVMMPVFPSLCDPFEKWDGPILRGKDKYDEPFRLYRFEGDFVQHRLSENMALPPVTMSDVRHRMFNVIDTNQWLEFILFTKRPQNIPSMWEDAYIPAPPVPIFPGMPGPLGQPLPCVKRTRHRRNVTLCYSASNQDTLDYGVPLLMQSRDLCPVLGISAEPLLGRIDMTGPLGLKDHATYYSPSQFDLDGPQLNWIIVGCESNGPLVGRLGDFKDEADWWNGCEEIVRQCQAADVPCYVKQGPISGRVSHDPAQWPEACRVREFPTREVARA